MEEYFKLLIENMEKAYRVASDARAKGFDPEDTPEILPTKDIAERVEGIVGPQGVGEGIRALGLDKANEDIAFGIVNEIIRGKYGEGSREELIERAIRAGVAILTEGVLVAPTEGISEIKIKKNPDGSEYLGVYFAGPIRSAGGTVAALSVVLADSVRRYFKIADYRPTDTEVERYVEEINLYDVRAARLQYKPADDEIRTIIRNCPVCIDGDPTEEFEVAVYRDLERVETNKVRGGMCLVIGEGIAQKAGKVLKYTKKIGLNWNWLENIIRIAKREGKFEIKADDRYLEDVVAGRPIFSYPNEKGGFRLRYGRSRNTGIAAKGVHPATMILLNNFLAVGTQMKIERPGKGCAVAPCDSIDGPIVKLADGSVLEVKTAEEAERIKGNVEKILFLGDILISSGDFIKSNHPLIPSGWCEEFWLKELESKGGKWSGEISAQEAFNISEKYHIPLHPKYTYFWEALPPEKLKELAEWLCKGNLVYDWFKLKELLLESAPTKEILETLCVPHTVKEKYIIISSEHAYALLRSLGLFHGRGVSLDRFNKVSLDKKTVDIISELAGVPIQEKAPYYIGARMGRPEKAKRREMKPAPHVLFPIGSMGGKTRSITKAFKQIKNGGEKGIIIEVVRRVCPKCGEVGILRKCQRCEEKTIIQKICRNCNKVSVRDVCVCGAKTRYYDERVVDLVSLMDMASRRCGSVNEVKGVMGMTSLYKIPEALEKGILRAKYDVCVFKDGTARFDATNLPLTHFYPDEIGVSITQLRSLGYDKDWEGKELVSEKQLVELKHQDIIISDNGAEYLFRVTKFIDELLVNYYSLEPFYKLNSPKELVGVLVIGLSPHTSCGVLERIIGFTKARVCYAHPYAISARRRNCDGDEDSVILLLDALINFSKKFLPEARGGTMDASLILTTIIDPKEVDDEVHSMEVCSECSLDFYKASLEFASPIDVIVERVGNRLGKKNQYNELKFTHHTSSIHNAPIVTDYVLLKSMRDKVNAQMELSEKIAAVKVNDAAERMILSHFLPDLYGNLRSFSRQTFRCVDCNCKFRRVPIIGKCTRCGGKLLLTINKGGVEKYLKISEEIAEKYGLPEYLKQRLALLKKDIESIFEDETSKQFTLAEFM